MAREHAEILEMPSARALPCLDHAGHAGSARLLRSGCVPLPPPPPEFAPPRTSGRYESVASSSSTDLTASETSLPT